MKPRPETEGASLLAMPVSPVSLEINQITSIEAHVVLQEEVQIVDGRVVIVPFGGERIVVHSGVSFGERAPHSRLGTIDCVIGGSRKAGVVGAVIDSRKIIRIDLVHETAKQFRIIVEVLVVVASVRKWIQIGATSGKKRRHSQTEYCMLDSHNHHCSLKVQFNSTGHGPHQRIGAYTRVDAFRINILDS